MATFVDLVRQALVYNYNGTDASNVITALVNTATISPLTTKGDLWGYDTANNRIPVGSNGQVLTADSTQTLGLKWAPAGGGGVPSGTNVCVGASNNPSNVGAWQNTTLAARMLGPTLTALPTSWNFSLHVNSATGVIVSNAVVRRTAFGSTTYIDSTTVTWGGNATPTLGTGVNTSDNIALALDTSHDYYILVYFSNSTNSGSTLTNYSNGTPTAALSGGFETGDQTGASTFTGYTGFAGATYIFKVNAA